MPVFNIIGIPKRERLRCREWSMEMCIFYTNKVPYHLPGFQVRISGERIFIIKNQRRDQKIGE